MKSTVPWSTPTNRPPVVEHHEFARDFSFEVLHDFPNGGFDLYFGGGRRLDRRNGIPLRIKSEKAGTYRALFAFGDDIDDGLDAVAALPDGGSLLVVANGAGFILTPDIREEPTRVELGPVRSMAVSLDPALVVLGCFRDAVAYGAHGIAWQRDIVRDFLELGRVENGLLEVRGDDGSAGGFLAHLHIADGSSSYRQ